MRHLVDYLVRRVEGELCAEIEVYSIKSEQQHGRKREVRAKLAFAFGKECVQEEVNSRKNSQDDQKKHNESARCAVNAVGYIAYDVAGKEYERGANHSAWYIACRRGEARGGGCLHGRADQADHDDDAYRSGDAGAVDKTFGRKTSI